MPAGRERVRRLLLSTVAGVALAAGLGGYAAESLRGMELSSVDRRFAIRGDSEPRDDLALVAIDDKTFSDLKAPFPFRRSLHARVIDALKADGARVIAYDVQFSELTDPEEDNALAESLRDAGNVVLATTEVDDEGRPNVLGGDPEALDFTRTVAGNANYVLQPGGTIRRMQYEIDTLKTFSVVAAEKAEGARIDRSELTGSTWIDFAGGPGTYPAVSFSDVLRKRFTPGRFRDRTVLVGAFAPSLQDVHPTSTTGDDLMAGAEIQANSIATALDGFPLEDAPVPLEVILIAFLGLVAPVAALRVAPSRALLLALAAGAVYVVAAQLAFNGGLVLDVSYPLAALAIGTVGTGVMGYVLSAFERERVRELFSRFVPEAVVDRVISEADGAVLGGVRRETTILFADLRGFTIYSEARHPSAVIDVLNRYLGAMSDVILDEGGTLVSYTGDGIMAVFGAPLDQEDHADRALAAARRMVAELEEFNRGLSTDGLGEGFRMGIGLNTGSTMVGNIGSERRLEYTAIGDAVNLASRLEGMTKDTGHQLFVADATRMALQTEPGDLVEVGDLDVPGRRRHVRVWTLS